MSILYKNPNDYPIFIFSVFRKDLEIKDNVRNHRAVELLLSDSYESIPHALGAYNYDDKVLPCFIVPFEDSEIRNVIQELCERYKQEFYFYISKKNRKVTQRSVGKKFKSNPIGKLVNCLESAAIQAKCWFFNSNSDEYFKLEEK